MSTTTPPPLEPGGNIPPETEYHGPASPYIAPTPQPPVQDKGAQISPTTGGSSGGSASVPSAGNPTGQHYPGTHDPNQVRPGEKAPEPLSHTPLEIAATLSRTQIIQLVRDLRRIRRDWYNDALWPIYEAELYRQLWVLFAAEQKSPLTPDVWEDLSLIRYFLHLKQLPLREPKRD